MAKTRADSSADSGREVRQQRLPLSWQEDPAAASAPSAAVPAAAPEPSTEGAAAPPEPLADGPAPVAPEPAADVVPAAVAPAAAAPVPKTSPATPAETFRVRAPQLATAAASPSEADPPGANTVAAAAPGGAVGEMLLSARADSGFSVEEVSQRTRIPRDVVEHLECSAYEALPSEYYCRAHIEKLCLLYNVDAAPILSQFHDDMVAHRGEAEGLGQFRAVTTDSESGARISYVLPGPGASGKGRSVSVTGAIVSAVIGLVLVMALVALTVLHFRNRDGKAPTGPVSAQVGHEPALHLKEFTVPAQLNAYELPIPDK